MSIMWQKNVLNEEIPKISMEDKESCENAICLEEIGKALKE
jgi:hypothetical protein